MDDSKITAAAPDTTELIDELKRLRARNEELESRLVEDERRRHEFVATLAHELRNPLAPIRNALQMMDLSREPTIHESARRIIERQLKQLIHLVDDLLDVMRVSQGRVALRLEQIDLAQCVASAIETSRPLIDAGRHTLDVTLAAAGTLRVQGDATRLTQVLANLLNNAAKYTPDGGRIRVSADRDGADALLRVCDSGIGIAPDMLPRVFDLFAQVDRPLERTQGGLGIGLTLVRRLVALHGGNVSASSDGAGRGSCFEVRLPLLDESAGAPGPLPAGRSAPAAKAQRVLVVDDNFDSARSMAGLLSMMGYQTDCAHDGLDAVALAERWRPAVVLMDIGMPRMNGLEAAEAIRRLPDGSDIALIAISGWGQQEDRRKSRDAGFDHHFVKPVDIEALVNLISRQAPR